MEIAENQQSLGVILKQGLGQTFPSDRYNQQKVDDQESVLGNRGDLLQEQAMVAGDKEDAAGCFGELRPKEKRIEKAFSPLNRKINKMEEGLF